MTEHHDDDYELPTGIAGVGLFGTGTLGMAAAAAVVPFFFHASETQTVNGQVVSHFDYIGVGGGGLALLLGAIGLVGAIRTDSPKRSRYLALAAVAILAGAYHLVSGLGLLV